MTINENVASIVRSVVCGGVAISFLAPVGGLTQSWKNISDVNLLTAQRAAEVTSLTAEYTDLQARLTGPCINYLFSNSDSKVETRAEDEIKEVFEGDVDFKAVCRWIVG